MKQLFYLVILTLFSFTAFTQIPTTGNVLWLKADAAVYNDAAATTLANNGQTVAQWNDQSGNTANAICTPTGYRPTFVTNVINGKPVLRFTNHYLQTPNIDLSTTDKTDMYVVYKSVAPNTNWEVVVEHGADYNSIIGFNLFENAQTLPYAGMYVGTSGGGYNAKNYPFKANEFKVVNASYDKGAAANAKTNLRINSKDITLYDQNYASGSGNFANNPLYIGNRGNAVGSYPLSGDIAEIILYNRKLTGAEKTQIESYLNTKYNIQCSVNNPQPGSGNCLQMGNYGASAQDDADIDFGTNDFTIEFWTMKRALSSGSANSACINKWNTSTVPGSNEWAIATSTNGTDNIPAFFFEAGTTYYQANATTSCIINKWYHIAAVREGNNLKIYVNGILEGTTAIPQGSSVNNVAARTYMALGYYPTGLSNNSNLDELRIWNTALSQTTIRDWMCKKETSLHPNHATLTRYYKFDEASGTIFGNQINNCVTEAYGNGGLLTRSGAPIGDNSAYDYTANTGSANINLGTPSDNLTASMNTGTSAGVHVYAVNELPNTLNYPGIAGNSKYAGVFVVNGNGTAAYNATYNYTNNTGVTPSIEPNLKLFKRIDNAATTWSTASNQTINTTTKNITATGQNTEYVLANAATPVAPTCYGTFNTGDLLNVTNYTHSYSLLDNNADNFTYEFWANPTQPLGPGSTSGDRYIVFPVQTNSVGRTGIGIGVAVGTDGIRVYGHTAAYLAIQLGYDYAFTGWAHIAVVYTAQVPSIYINGLLVATGTANGIARASDFYLQSNQYSQYIGSTTDFRLWNYARTGAEINAGMNTPPPVNAAGLQSLILFNNLYNGAGQLVKNACTNLPLLSLDKITAGTNTTPSFNCNGINFPSLVVPTCAAKFNGTNSYVDIVNTPTTMPNKGTIEFWMNQPSFSDWQIPLSTFSPSVNTGTFTDGMYFQTYANGNLYFIYASSISVYGIELLGTLTTNKNYHVALSWDLTANTIKGYLDSKLIFIKALTTTFPTTLPRFSLGGGFANARFYNGTLDEVRYWNVERTQAQLISKASDSLVGNEAGLQAYYRFNDNSINGAGQTITNYATATGAALNGTTVNYVKFPCTVNPPTCGITLSGAAGEGVQVPHNAALNSTTNITYEAWVKPSTNVAAYRRIVGKGGNGTQEAPGIYVQQTTGKVSAGILINGVQQIVTSALAINDNEWHHTAFTYDGTTLKLYVDGTLDGTLTAVGTITTNASPLDIGYNSPLNLYPFIGKIDEVRVWNTTRTLSQIQTLMNGSLIGNESGLVAYYHFNDNSRSGQSRTVTNFCTVTGSILNGSTFGTALTPVFECAPPPFSTPECNMVLNGTTDYAQVANNAAINLSQFSVGAYFKTTNTGTVKTILIKDVDGTNNNYKLSISATNKAQISFVNTALTTVAAVGTTTITDGSWHYAVGTFDGTNLKIYVDGVLETTIANTTTAITGANALNIGVDNVGSNKYNGSIDELSVWNTALPLTQIQSLIGQRLVGNEANLVAYYNFAGNSKNGQGVIIANSCITTGAALNAITAGTTSTPIFTCSEIPVTDPTCSILLNGYADAVKAINGSSPVTYPAISQNFTMEIVAKPLLEKRGSGTGGYPIWPPGHYIQNGQVGQAFVIAPDDGNSFGVGHAGVGISLGTNGIGVYEGATGYLQAPAVYNAPIADWSHITVVSENGALKLYVNGALKNNAAASGFILHPSIGLSGYSSPLTPNYAGYVSEVRIWNTARTSDEIRNNINANLTGVEANLVSLYKFGSNTSNGDNQIITGSGSMAGSIVYKTVGSNYTPLFTCANTTNVPKDTLPGSGKTLTFTGNGLYSALNGSAFAELGNWGNVPVQGSISCWFNATTIKNNAVLFTTTHFRNQTGKHKGFNVFIKNNKLLLTIGTDTTVTGYQDTITVMNTIAVAKWNHFTLVWDAVANSYNVFINGLSVASGTSLFLPTKFESVKAGSGIVAGYAYAWDGLIDELSEWNKILTLAEIRQQMCSKINTTQANYANVLHYYRFDNTTSSNNFISDYAGTAHGIYCLPFLFNYTIYGNGGLFFQDQIPAHYFTDLPTSSAPIGAYSSYQYAGNTSATSLNIGNAGTITNADVVTATVTSGTAEGIHIYGEDVWPNTVNGVVDTVLGSKRYAGVFVANSNAAQYNFIYDYTNSPYINAGNEPYLRLKKRDHNAITTWIAPSNMVQDQNANTITCTGQNTEYILEKSLVPLPLKWLLFTAELNSNKQTVLNWKVTEELNVNSYQILWSTDGINFKPIANINYNGTAKGNYVAIHLQPINGNNYYRIKQIDNDTKYSYSTVQIIKIAEKILVSVYPNPTSNTINILGWNTITQMQLFDVSGKKINEWQQPQPTINLSKIGNGIYILKVRLKTGETVEQKIIVQH